MTESCVTCSAAAKSVARSSDLISFEESTASVIEGEDAGRTLESCLGLRKKRRLNRDGCDDRDRDSITSDDGDDATGDALSMIELLGSSESSINVTETGICKIAVKYDTNFGQTEL
jgi:hypothetical protein